MTEGERVASGNGINMDPTAVGSLGNQLQDFAAEVGQMADYASADKSGLTAAHFGRWSAGQQAGKATIDAITALAKSVTTAQQFLSSAATALATAAKTTQQTDEDAAAGISKAGQGS